jgi:ABC-2 type transport system permease protein
MNVRKQIDCFTIATSYRLQKTVLSQIVPRKSSIMFFKIFKYEVKYWLRKPVFYFYLLSLFGIGMLAMLADAGFFKDPITAVLPPNYSNSPSGIVSFFSYFNRIFLFLLPTIIGATLYKDYQHNVHSLLYSFPIKKRDYLAGKFLGSFFIVIILTLSTGVCLAIAEQFPGLYAHKIGDFDLLGYLQSYSVFTISTMLIYGLLVFSVVLWFRNIYTGFVTIIALFFLQKLLETTFDGDAYLIALSDPFAIKTMDFIAKDLTIAQRNSSLLPVYGVVLYNRLLWFGLSAVIAVVTYFRFSLSEHVMVAFNRLKKGKRMIKDNFQGIKKVNLPEVSFNFGGVQNLRNIWCISSNHFRFITRNKLFLFLAVLGLCVALSTLSSITNRREMTLLPVTRLVLMVPSFLFKLVIMGLTFIYVGMLIHRERTASMNQLVDIVPVPNWVLFLGKLVAIVRMQMVLLCILIVAGVSIQIFNNYYHFEFGLYLFYLFGIHLVWLLVWTLAAFFLHISLDNLYISIFLLLSAWLGFELLPQLGVSQIWLRFNATPPVFYSDLNGFGNQLGGYYLVESYWLAFGIFLSVIAYLLWERGTSNSWKQRWSLLKSRLDFKVAGLAVASLVLFGVLGFKIYEVQESRFIKSEKDMGEKLKVFKENFQQYANFPQPKVSAITANIELYPNSKSFVATGSYQLINRTENPIDTLLVKCGFDEITELILEDGNEIVARDDFAPFYIIKLRNAIQAKDSLHLEFKIKSRANTLLEQNSNILANGTFLKQDIFPKIGYADNTPPKHPTDSTARLTNYQTQFADLVSMDFTIGTSENQTVIAPGTLQKKWKSENRNYFHFVTPNPIKFSFGFNSGEFEVEKYDWKNKEFAVYYHETHKRNLKSLLGGLKSALEYNTKYFGEYQHKSAQVVEFPHSVGTFATTFANSIPTSEIRFIANSDTANGTLDFAFYVTAHELTHQWWGNQIIPANALGSVMLTESVTEYISGNIYKHT